MLVATALPMFMATLDNLVMTNALPVLHEEFGASVEELQWFMNAYTLAFASTILMAVALGDRFGRRTLFLIGIVVFTLSSAFAALATDPGQLIAARALQGFGAAAIMPLSLTLLAGSVPLARRPLAIGIWGGVAGLGVATGPLIGGAVIEGWAWQAIFWINVPVGVVSVALALLALPNSFGARLRADVVGPRALGPRPPRPRLRHRARQRGRLGQPRGARQPHRAAASCSPRSSLWEARAAAPLLPLRLFRDRSFTVANVVGLRVQLRRVRVDLHPHPVPAGRAGLDSARGGAADLAVDARADGRRAARRVHRRPRRHPRPHRHRPARARRSRCSGSPACSTPRVEYSAYVAPFIVAGIGMGLVFAPSATAVLATMAPDDHAKASGTNSMLREVGVALGIAVSTAVFTGAGGALNPVDYAVGAAARRARGRRGAASASALVALLLPAGRAVKAAPRRRQPPSAGATDDEVDAPVPVGGARALSLRPDPYDGGPVPLGRAGRGLRSEWARRSPGRPRGTGSRR